MKAESFSVFWKYITNILYMNLLFIPVYVRIFITENRIGKLFPMRWKTVNIRYVTMAIFSVYKIVMRCENDFLSCKILCWAEVWLQIRR